MNTDHARLVNVQLSLNGSKNIEFTITNHGQHRVRNVLLENVKREDGFPGESWRRNPNVSWPFGEGGFILAPGEEHHQLLVQLLDSSGQPISLQRSLRVVYSLRFQDVENQWWRMTGPETDDLEPIYPPSADI